MTSNDSAPITDRERMMSYYARRDKFARLTGEPELGRSDYDNRMASRAGITTMPIDTTAITLGLNNGRGYVSMTHHGGNGQRR